MKRNLCLFFSNDTSLINWKNSGILNREINYYKKFQKKKFNLTFLTYGDRTDKLIKNTNLKQIKILPIYEKISRPKNYILRNILNIILPTLILRKQKFDYLKVNQISGGLGGLIASLFLRKKIFFRIGWEPNILNRYIKSNIFKKLLHKILSLIVYNVGNTFSVSSLKIKKFVMDTCLFKKIKKIYVIENFIDTNKFRKIKKKKFKKKIIMISRLSKEKNIEFLIEAIKGTDIEVDIIGNGQEKNRLKRIAKNEGAKLNFLGSKDNIHLPKYLNSYHVYVICSKIEGNVKTLLEAMACELICIGTKVDGIKNIIQNKKTGFTVNTSKELKNRLLKIFTNVNKYKKLRKSARYRILKLNSIDTFFNQELKLLRNI
jgi:glycosyltransferase involved in cell wall biosynthesis